MSYLSRKFVALLMMLWLPLFSGSALAESVLMQMPQGSCHETVASHEMQAMDDMDMSEHHQHHGAMPAAADEQNPSNGNCGVCHLACTAYLAVPGMKLATVQTAARESAPYLASFRSITSVPLLPPPLVRA